MNQGYQFNKKRVSEGTRQYAIVRDQISIRLCRLQLNVTVNAMVCPKPLARLSGRRLALLCYPYSQTRVSNAKYASSPEYMLRATNTSRCV